MTDSKHYKRWGQPWERLILQSPPIEGRHLFINHLVFIWTTCLWNPATADEKWAPIMAHLYILGLNNDPRHQKFGWFEGREGDMENSKLESFASSHSFLPQSKLQSGFFAEVYPQDLFSDLTFLRRARGCCWNLQNVTHSSIIVLITWTVSAVSRNQNNSNICQKILFIRLINKSCQLCPSRQNIHIGPSLSLFGHPLVFSRSHQRSFSW